METIVLKDIKITYQEKQLQPLDFQKAELVMVTEFGNRQWYIDIDGVSDSLLLAWFGQSEDIKVEVQAISTDGDIWMGVGYFHPNESRHAAAIRGDGELYKL